MNTLHILIVTGVRSKRSYTRTLAATVGHELDLQHTKVCHWDLGAEELPVADPAYYEALDQHPNRIVQRFAALVLEADAIVLATPVYHNSFSAVLKNALDTLDASYFQYKPVGLLSHGSRRATQAVDQLRLVVRSLHAIAIPQQVCTSREDYAEDDEGYAIASLDIHRRIQLFAAELTFLAFQARALRGSRPTSAAPVGT